jgi:hypothetical protein
VISNLEAEDKRGDLRKSCAINAQETLKGFA